MSWVNFLFWFPHGCILIMLGMLISDLGWSTWSRAKAMKVVLTMPSSVTRAWVEPPGKEYAVHILKARVGNHDIVLAKHEKVRNIVCLLKEQGICVEDVPTWCEDNSASPPKPVAILEDEGTGGPFDFIIYGILSPALVLSLVVATVISSKHLGS